MTFPREEAREPREAKATHPRYDPSTSSTSSSHGDYSHATATALPHGARPLSPWDYAALLPIFSHYLALHDRRPRTPRTPKTGSYHDLGTPHQLDADTRRCWLRFLGRWNGGRLPAGWYHPQMCLRAMRAQAAAAAVVSWVAADQDLWDGLGDDEEEEEDSRYGDFDFLSLSTSSTASSSSSSDGLFSPCHPPSAVMLEHVVRLQELLPRSRKGGWDEEDAQRGVHEDGPAPAGNDEHYRRMLAMLWQQRERSRE